MLFPPWPDNEQAWLLEIRTSPDNSVWTDFAPLAWLASTRTLFRYYQVRVTLSRQHAPYRPALRSLAVVCTN
ncbi:MAG: hypothetical protein IT437_04075 [Phycisphaerales bacterium]|nr:hypothetical protein [Phycisphaerales bacterium]